MKIQDIKNIDLLRSIENATELRRLNKYKPISYLKEYIGLHVNRSYFYGTLNGTGDTGALSLLETVFDSPGTVTLLIEGTVVLGAAPINTGAGDIVYVGYGVLEVEDVVVYDGRVGSLHEDVENLKNITFKVTYYELINISATTTGSLNDTPLKAIIQEGQFGESGNSVLSTLTTGGEPTFETPFDGIGTAITANLSTDGSWVASDTYVDQVALVYSLTLKLEDWDNLNKDFAIDYYDIQNAHSIDYDNTSSTLTATDVNEAIDELESKKFDKAGGTITGDTIVKGSVMEFEDITGEKKGVVGIGTDFGMVMSGGIVDGNPDAPSAVAGNNVNFIGEAYGFQFNGAEPGDFLKFGNEVDIGGRRILTLATTPLDVVAYSEDFQSTTNVVLTTAYQNIIQATIANPYSDGTSTSLWQFRLENSSKSDRVVEYIITSNDGVSPDIFTINVPKKQSGTNGFAIASSSDTISDGSLVATDTVEIQVKVVSGTDVTVVADTGTPVKLRLEQNAGIASAIQSLEDRKVNKAGDTLTGNLTFESNDIAIIAGAGITIEGTVNGAILYIDPSAGDIDEVLGSATLYEGKTFTLKRTTNGGNIAKFAPATGEFIDNISSLYHLVLGRKNDAITIHSNGTNWYILDRYTTNLAVIQCLTPGSSQGLVNGVELEIDCFDYDVTSSFGRLTADSANNKVIIENKEDIVEPYHIQFKLTGEFDINAVELDIDLYVDGVFQERLASQFLQKRNKNYTILGDTIITFFGAVPADITVRITSDKTGTLTYEKITLVVEGTRG